MAQRLDTRAEAIRPPVGDQHGHENRGHEQIVNAPYRIFLLNTLGKTFSAEVFTVYTAKNMLNVLILLPESVNT